MRLLSKCKFYRRDVSNTKDKYLHYGKGLKFFTKNLIIMVLTVVLSATLLTGCSGNGSSSNTAGSTTSGVIDGWSKDGTIYSYYKNGKKVIGDWVQSNGYWFYMNEAGKMVTSAWVEDGPTKYYINSNGWMSSNRWEEIDGKQYYFGSSGALAKNTTTPDGYIVGSDGAWTGETVKAAPTPAVGSTQRSSYESTAQSNSYTVYITKTGKKYHGSGCRYLSNSKISISKEDAISRGYTPCSVCNP